MKENKCNMLKVCNQNNTYTLEQTYREHNTVYSMPYKLDSFTNEEL